MRVRKNLLHSPAESVPVTRVDDAENYDMRIIHPATPVECPNSNPEITDMAPADQNIEDTTRPGPDRNRV